MKSRNPNFRPNFRQRSMKRGLFLIPNLLTTANLFCGFYSITRAIAGQYSTAAWLVILATFFDFLDGRVARMTNSQSDFGVEYDSLSDLTTFCMAPAVLAYLFGLSKFGKFGIAAAFLYFACGALRLARFNVQAGNVEKTDFQGLPTPSAGGMMCSYIIFFLEMFGPSDKKSFILLALTVGLGLLMVSSVRYRSFKKFQRTSFLFLVIVVAVVFLMVTQPAIAFFAIGVVYISIGIIEWLWKSPQKIRSIKDLWIRLYNERNEDLFFEDEFDDEEGDADLRDISEEDIVVEKLDAQRKVGEL